MHTKVVQILNASWSNGAGLAVLEKVTGSKYSVENNEKDDSTEILISIGDVLKIIHHPQSEELEEAAVESHADIVMVPPDED